MIKNNLKITFILITVLLNLFVLNINNIKASEVARPKTEAIMLNIPVYNLGGLGSGRGFPLYIRAWYNFMLGTIGILASIMIMIGGFKYLTSQGDKGQIQAAQNTIISAITGLVLAFGMHAILSLVNPELLKLKIPDIRDIEYEGTYDDNSIENPGGGGYRPNTTLPSHIVRSNKYPGLEGTPEFVAKTEAALDRLRAEGKIPEGFYISSSYRPNSSNPNSLHRQGIAFDCSWPGISHSSATEFASNIRGAEPSFSTIVEKSGDWGSTWRHGWGVHVEQSNKPPRSSNP